MKKIAIIVLVIAAIVVAFALLKKPATAPVDGTPSASPSPEAEIIIDSPKSGASVSNPILVTGRARVFERQFSYRLKDASGRILYESFAMTGGPDLPEYGTFSIKIPVPVSDPEIISGNGSPNSYTVEVFEHSAKDGEIINLAAVTVSLASTETTTVEAFYSNSTLDPLISCTKVFPVKRKIYKTQEVGYVALFELLRGPSKAELLAGYTTTIPANVGINSLVIRDGTAYADFNHILEQSGGGSCKVQAIRSQITETLKQFPTVKNVVISINGRTEDILQP